jgi:hypothetical protein
MRKVSIVLFISSIFIYANENISEEIPYQNSLTITEAIVEDYNNFYSSDRLLRLGIGFGVGAIVANSAIDANIQNWYQDTIRTKSTDNFSNISKTFGEGKYLIPITLLAGSINYFEPESDIGVWGVYASRAYLTAAPTLLLMQRVTGGSRPGEENYGSDWNPFIDDNGVSGHAFIGAVPFLTLAHMYEDNQAVKYLAYGASFLTAWSRVNDNAHYTSQAALGWYLAYESVDAVFDSTKKSDYSIAPTFGRDSYGLSVQMKW